MVHGLEAVQRGARGCRPGRLLAVLLPLLRQEPLVKLGEPTPLLPELRGVGLRLPEGLPGPQQLLLGPLLLLLQVGVLLLEGRPTGLESPPGVDLSLRVAEGGLEPSPLLRRPWPLRPL